MMLKISDMEEQRRGWIARDEGGELHFFFAKPCRIENRKDGSTSLLSIWANSPNGNDSYKLPPMMFFPELQWENEPKKATMTIETGWAGQDLEALHKVSEIQKRIDSGEITDLEGLRLLLEELREMNDN